MVNRSPIPALILLSAALGLLALSGCALDPMEKLKEQVVSQEAAMKREAVVKLINLHDDRAIESLVDLLDSDEDVYNEAGYALVKQGREVNPDKKPNPVIAMVAAIMNNAHLAVSNRCRAAWVLGEIGDRDAIPVLRNGAAAKDAAGNACAPVRDQAKLALKKLGENSDGAAFEISKNEFKGGPVNVIPELKSLAPAEEDAEKKDAGPKGKAKKPAEAKPAVSPPPPTKA
jgi:HEAT repeat protein